MTGKKPPKLPPLPKVRKLPALKPRNPKVAEVPVWRPKLDDETSQSKDGFGGETTGRWFETGKEHGQVGGTCWKCGRKRKAENLRLYTRPFGKGEVWICKEDC